MSRFHRIGFLSGLALLATISGAPEARSEVTSQGGYAGIYLGIARPSLEGYDDVNLGYGLSAGLKFHEEYSAGLYFLTSTSEASFGATASLPATVVENRVSFYGVEGDYHFLGTLEGLRAGVRVGLSTKATTTSPQGVASVSQSDTDFALGPQLGYDFMISEQISVGGEANIFFVLGGDSFNVIHALGTAKFHF